MNKMQIDSAIREIILAKHPHANFEHILYYFNRPYFDLIYDIGDDDGLIDYNSEYKYIYCLKGLKTILVPYRVVTDIFSIRSKFFNDSMITYDELIEGIFNGIYVPSYEAAINLDRLETYIPKNIEIPYNLKIDGRLYPSKDNNAETKFYLTTDLIVLCDIEKVINNIDEFENIIIEEIENVEKDLEEGPRIIENYKWCKTT